MWSECRNKMRTSPKQFDIMVSFMEQHGDLNKPPKHLSSRMRLIRDWMELTTQLNSDPAGEQKTTDKWKKVWSDFKNNTKRKAAKLQNPGPNQNAAGIRLSDIEQRVLNIIAAPMECVDYAETIVPEEITSPPPPLTPPPTTPPEVNPDVKNFSICEIDSASSAEQDWEQAGSSKQVTETTPPVSESPVQLESIIPAVEGQTPICYKRAIKPPRSLDYYRKRARGGPRSNVNFIKYVIEKGRAETELEKERLRIRQEELNVQKQWQDVAVKAVDALHKFINTKMTEQ